jgi:hypothetical protein
MWWEGLENQALLLYEHNKQGRIRPFEPRVI